MNGMSLALAADRRIAVQRDGAAGSAMAAVAGTQSQRCELTVLRELLDGLGQVIVRLEKDKAELTSGLRAEKAHVAQLRRQIELLRH